MYDIGFINTSIIDEFLVTKNAEEAEANLLQSLLKNQNKDKILFPYNFKWVLMSYAYSVSLIITRGYSNVIDELCMRAQLPLYSARDPAWEGSSNYHRLETKRSPGLCKHDYNAPDVSSIDHYCTISAILFNWSWYQMIIFFVWQGLERVHRNCSGTAECRVSCDLHTQK